MTTLSGTTEVIEQARALTKNEEALRALARLEAIYEGLKEKGCEKYITFDLSMLSKYNYYTGIVFRAYSYGYGGQGRPLRYPAFPFRTAAPGGGLRHCDRSAAAGPPK